MSYDPVYTVCMHELKDLVDKWVKKWYKPTGSIDPSKKCGFNYITLERMLLENLYEVHNEICDTV